MPAGIGFAICGEDEASARSHLVYDVDPVTVSAEDVLGERKADGPQIAEAKTFLMVALADGAWHPARDLEDEAATKDIGARTLRRARRHLPIECRKGGFDGGWSGAALPPRRAHERLPRARAREQQLCPLVSPCVPFDERRGHAAPKGTDRGPTEDSGLRAHPREAATIERSTS